MGLTRRRVLYSGRVQGVGFRATACQTARDHAVVGSVRNLPDGRVELVAEGEGPVVGAFLAAIDRALGCWVLDVQVSSEPPSEPPAADFRIRYD
mgnify:CR=1 FL=1